MEIQKHLAIKTIKAIADKLELHYKKRLHKMNLPGIARAFTKMVTEPTTIKTIMNDFILKTERKK